MTIIIGLLNTLQNLIFSQIFLQVPPREKFPPLFSFPFCQLWHQCPVGISVKNVSNIFGRELWAFSLSWAPEENYVVRNLLEVEQARFIEPELYSNFELWLASPDELQPFTLNKAWAFFLLKLKSEIWLCFERQVLMKKSLEAAGIKPRTSQSLVNAVDL